MSVRHLVQRHRPRNGPAHSPLQQPGGLWHRVVHPPAGGPPAHTTGPGYQRIHPGCHPGSPAEKCCFGDRLRVLCGVDTLALEA